LLLILGGISATIAQINRTTVTALDVNRYMGTWYELARYPHVFEKNLVGVSATYALQPDGKITVINQGFKNTLSGQPTLAKGNAFRPDAAIPGKLKVSFFLWFYSDYLVLELEENYQWVIVGSSSDDFLWILSRQAKVSDELYATLVDKVKKRGYDPAKLIRVPQK
jgi:apolipoprotein D and lipocalin family protein